jgi:alpha-L-arabinofuranosidase
MKHRFTSIIALLLISVLAFSQPLKIKVDVANPGAEINRGMYGIFYEDINHAGEGGLYAELINNRSFEAARMPEDMYREGHHIRNRQNWKLYWPQPDSLFAWSISLTGGVKGQINLSDELPLNEFNPNSMCMNIENLGAGKFSVINKGFWGINLVKGDKYDLSLYARCNKDFKGKLEVKLIQPNGNVIASQMIEGIGSDWKKFNCTFTATISETQGQFVVSPTSEGKVWVDMVSLFPQKTFKNRPNGLRADLAQKITDMRPGFLRFPGGCVVEGASLANRIQWKNTIGDIAKRPGRWELWGYHNTDGVGFHEFLQFCEDINCDAMYVVPVGMSCQFRKAEIAHKEHLQPYIEEALEALEYAMGPVNTKWGAERAKNGHPAPFKIKYLEIGNENYGPVYQEYYNYFYKAIKEKYPQILTIACTDPGMRDAFKRTDLPGITQAVEMIDEHFYESTDFFYKNAFRYDNYCRKGPKVYVGEYAVKKWDNSLKGNLDGALAEAAFMLGFERNADLVSISSQAPTLVNVNDRTWNPDMINFDNNRNYGTPSYHVTKLLSLNMADKVLPVETNFTYLLVDDNEGYGMAGFNNMDGVAQYKDVKIRIGNKWFEGKNLVTPDAWAKSQNGSWKVKDFDFVGLPFSDEVLKTAGNGKWKDYTLMLKAKAETVNDLENMCVFFYKTGANKHFCWNLSRWNRYSWLEWYDNGYTSYFGQQPGKLELNRWYNIKIDVIGDSISCYLDNKLVHHVAIPKKVVPGIYTSAGAKENGDIILKVVNATEDEKPVEIDLDGATGLSNEGTASVITSANRLDENTLDNPEKVSARTSTFKGVSGKFTYKFEARSLTVLTISKMSKKSK